MAVLSSADRAALCAGYQREDNGPHGAITKAQLRAAIDAADDWANANAAGYNSALPLPARTVLTSAQKARLLALVILRRWQTGA